MTLTLARSSLLRNAIAAVLVPAAVAAQQPEPQSGALEEITVTGTRIIRSGMVTPVPTTAVDAAELQNMSAGPMFDSLVQLPPFFANQAPEQVNGGQNSGGSNLNLRGAGLNRTLVLLDGRRIVPTNRFGAVDVAMFPEELVQSVEVVTGGASASYGTDAVAGVVNFKLDTGFEGFKGHAQMGETSYGDGETYEAGFAFGVGVGERGHLIGSIEKFNVDPISDFGAMQERSFFNNVARVTNPSPTGPANLVRPYVEPTTWNQTGIINHAATQTAPAGPLNKYVFNPDGTVTPLAFSGVGQLDGGCACQATGERDFGSDVDNEVAASNERETLFLHYNHDLNDNVSFYAQALAGENEVSDRRENISFILTWAPRLFADNVYLPTNIAQQIATTGITADNGPGYPRYVNFALFGVNDGVSGLPDVRQLTKNELFSGTFGFDVELDREGFLDGWRMNAYYQRGNNEQNFDTDNGIRVDRIPLAFDAVRHPTTGQPVCYSALVNPAVFGDCVPMNIFGGLQNLTPEAKAYIVDDYKVAFQDTTQDFAEFVMTGDVWDGWGAGAIAGAFGASYRSEDLNQSTPDPTDEFPATPSGVLLENLGVIPAGVRGLIEEYRPGGQLGSGIRNVPAGFRGDANSSAITFSSLRAISGGYDVREAFGELNIPIVSNAGWANQFDISTAVRWADYSGSGEIWAGKVGMNWQVSDAVRLRLTQSRDVRAATLRERFDQTRGGVTVTDPLKGGASISTASFSGGNPNVNPEKADTTTAGIVFQPTGIDGLSVSFDWYEIDINDAIAQLAAQAVVNSCVPTNQSLCAFVIRDPVTADIVRVDNLFINLQRQVIEGTDLELTYSFGDFALRTFVTRLMENSVQNPGGVPDDRAGDIGGANAGLPDLKVTANLNWTRGPFSMFVQERYIGGGKLDRFLIEGDRTLIAQMGLPSTYSTIDDNSIDSTYYTDLGIRYTLGTDDAWEIFGNINNLFDQEPRATAQILGRAGVNEFNQSALLYDVLGRTMVVGARLSF